jgi:Leucine-rich repeat (LRR) protein
VSSYNLLGIGLLSRSPIEEINLGMNKLTGLPLEFGQLKTLKTLWLDDNEFELFPTAICSIPV